MTPQEARLPHGIDGAAYVLQAFGEHWPCLWCQCGEFFADDSWENVGAALDEHLAEAKEEASP